MLDFSDLQSLTAEGRDIILAGPKLEPLKYRLTYQPPCLPQILATPPYKRIYPESENPFSHQKNYFK